MLLIQNRQIVLFVLDKDHGRIVFFLIYIPAVKQGAVFKIQLVLFGFVGFASQVVTNFVVQGHDKAQLLIANIEIMVEISVFFRGSGRLIITPKVHI